MRLVCTLVCLAVSVGCGGDGGGGGAGSAGGAAGGSGGGAGGPGGGPGGVGGAPGDFGDVCAGAGVEGFPAIFAFATETAELGAMCLTLTGEEMVIHLALRGPSEQDFVARLEAVLESFSHADVAVTPQGAGASLEGTGPAATVRAYAEWSGGVTRYFIATKPGTGVAKSRPSGDWVEKDGRPCNLPQAEIDLCKFKNLKSVGCDGVPGASDSCREILQRVTDLECQRGNSGCGPNETCQDGVCCTIGTLACGNTCYDPDDCKTCQNGAVVVRGSGLGGRPDATCVGCQNTFSLFGGADCMCVIYCGPEECCPEGDGGKCVPDKSTDRDHCGRCGNSCPQGQDCRFGSCNGLGCAENEVPCHQQCCRPTYFCADELYCCAPCEPGTVQCAGGSQCGYVCCPPDSVCCPGMTPDEVRCCGPRGCNERPGFCN